jgi:hypothetical protein
MDLEDLGTPAKFVLDDRDASFTARPRPSRCRVPTMGLESQSSAVSAGSVVATVKRVAGRWKCEAGLDALCRQRVTAVWLPAGGNGVAGGGR